MESTLYFKDMRNRDHNNFPKKVYKVEPSRMFIEVLDSNHIKGKPHYFTSPHSRNDFITNIKEYILRINDNELKEIQNYWQQEQADLSHIKK